MKQWIGIYMLAALCFCSCAEEGPEVVQAGEEGHALTLTYTIPDAEAATRAASSYVEATGNESVVDGLHLLFFEPDAHGNGAHVATASATLKDANLKQNMITVTLPPAVLKANEYSVLVIANLAKFTAAPDAYLATFATKTYGRAWEELQATLPLTAGKYSFPDGRLPMSGTTVKRAGKDEMSVDLLRAAVRVDVAVGDALTATATLSHVELRNVAQAVPFFRTQEEISTPRVGSSQLTVTGNKLTGGLYAVETSLDVTDSKILMDDATCLLVDIKDPAVHKNGDAANTWYRVNLNVDADGRQYLKRNNAYRVVITAISGPGAPSADEAYKSGVLLISAVTMPAAWKESGLTPPEVSVAP